VSTCTQGEENREKTAMATMIKVTRQRGSKPVWLNADHIDAVQVTDATSTGCQIEMAVHSGKYDGVWQVQESAEQVVALINGSVSPTEPVS
jgi:uncharacterized protein YlzI (FlbEa/FlbD family)